MKIRIPLAVDLHINRFYGATISEYDRGIVNGIVDRVGDRLYVTQRPSIDIFDDASATVADARGRAIYYWDENNGLYFVNNATVYKNAYSSPLGTISAGTQKCYFMTLNSNLILIDPENDQGWIISKSGVLSEITDTDFPPKQTPAVGLAYGGAVLDGYLFVLGVNGIVYNSDLENPASWTGTNYIDAERDPDGGAYLGKHHDHIVVFGVRTIEFFYDAGNLNGSPLSRRQDVAYNIGCSDGRSVWEEGDRTFFIGSAYSGALGAYVLENFSVRKVSTSTIDSFLSQAIVKDGYAAVGSGFTAQGHTYYMITLHTTPADILPEVTLVYDATANIWSIWETAVSGLTRFPLVGWSIRTAVLPRYGEGILSNGDLITINDDLTPIDTVLESRYVQDGYVSQGYVAQDTGTNQNVAMKVRSGQFDGGTDLIKFCRELRHVGDETTNSGQITFKWSDEESSAFTSGKSVDPSKYRKIRRAGRFRRRNIQIEYSGPDAIRLEALEMKVEVGTK